MRSRQWVVCALGETERVRVLLIEDDLAIAESVRLGLEREGMTVTHVTNGRDALSAVDQDVLLLDIGLPDMDGFEVCRRVRAVSNVPIIMLTARGDEIDRVAGLESGADDYVPKPFGLRELVARIRAVVRRSSSLPESKRLEVNGLVVDLATRTVRFADKDIALTAKEFDLLAHLAQAPGVVHRRHDILESVWDTEWYGPTKTLDAHVASLRKKLGHPEWIEAVRGVGFRLVVT